MESGKLVGLVTEGDLIMQDVRLEYPTYIHLLDGFIMYPPAQVKFESELKKAVAATVADVMSGDPVTVQPSASLEDIASLLAERDVSRLPVLDGEELVGIVSKHDIVRAIAQGLS
jgi:CBS domain-containing protein